MISDLPTSLEALAAKAGEAARLLSNLSNEHRLLILCHLSAQPGMTVGALVTEVGLSQSALSQHLARLRADGLVASRREAQTMHYRIDDDAVLRVLAVLRDIYCPELMSASGGEPQEPSR